LPERMRTKGEGGLGFFASKMRPAKMIKTKMRLMAFVLATFVAATFVAATFVAVSPAAAQSWTEYSYPDYAFTVSFPAEPRVETTTYPLADGRAAPARVYSASQEGGVFKMTIVDLTQAGLEESAVIDQAVKRLSQGGEIKLDIPHRISRVFGRQLSIQAADGSHSSVAVFYYKQRLYQIEGRTSGKATADAIRFQQSLVFTDSD
jgi:hypothetical protein